MQSILNVTYPAVFKFSFTQAEIIDGKAFINTYQIKQIFTINSHADLESMIEKIAEKCVVNPVNISFEIVK